MAKKISLEELSLLNYQDFDNFFLDFQENCAYLMAIQGTIEFQKRLGQEFLDKDNFSQQWKKFTEY